MFAGSHQSKSGIQNSRAPVNCYMLVVMALRILRVSIGPKHKVAAMLEHMPIEELPL